MEEPKLQVVLPKDYEMQIFQQLLVLSQKAIEQAQKNVLVNDRYLTQDQLKKFLEIGQSTLDRLISEEGLKFIRLGNKKMYDLRDVEEVLNRMKI